VAVEFVRQFLSDERPVTADGRLRIFGDHRQAERLADGSGEHWFAPGSTDRYGLRRARPRPALRHAAAWRKDVRGVGVDDVEAVERDALATKPVAQLDATTA
jgi:hypothetical protein